MNKQKSYVINGRSDITEVLQLVNAVKCEDMGNDDLRNILDMLNLEKGKRFENVAWTKGEIKSMDALNFEKAKKFENVVRAKGEMKFMNAMYGKPETVDMQNFMGPARLQDALNLNVHLVAI